MIQYEIISLNGLNISLEDDIVIQILIANV